MGYWVALSLVVVAVMRVAKKLKATDATAAGGKVAVATMVARMMLALAVVMITEMAA